MHLAVREISAARVLCLHIAAGLFRGRTWIGSDLTVTSCGKDAASDAQGAVQELIRISGEALHQKIEMADTDNTRMSVL